MTKAKELLMQINESMWTLQEAEKFIVDYLEPVFKKFKLDYKIVGSVSSEGKSDNDLDLSIKILDEFDWDEHSMKYWNSFMKALRALPVVKAVEDKDDMNYGSMATVFLKDGKIIDLFFGWE